MSNIQGTHTVVGPMTMQAPAIVPVVPRGTMNVSTIRGLAITQIVIGFLTLCLGIGTTAGLSKHYWLTESGGGIWAGIWILITGIIGVASASQPANGGLNGTHMAFCIISTVIAFIDGIMFAVGIGFYNNCNRFSGYYYYYSYRNYGFSWYCHENSSLGKGLYGPLLLLMIAEFFIALVAAIHCCQAASGCCNTPATQGIIIQPQPQYIVTSSTGQTVMTSGYPVSSAGYQVSTAGYPVSTAGYPAPAAYSPQQQYYPYPPPMTVQPQMPGNATSVAYSSQPFQTKESAPPPYSK